MSERQAFFSGVTAAATLIAAVTLLTGAKAPPTKFEEIDVGRINIREPDGTVRLVISNRAQFPGAWLKGQEIPHEERRDYAGMIFVNEEGTENGGLIQRGSVGKDGKPLSVVHLSFDRFRQDQVLMLQHIDEGNGKPVTGLTIRDETDGMALDAMARAERYRALEKLPEAEQKARIDALKAQGLAPAQRVRLGTTGERDAILRLSDPQGRPRLILTVSAAGEPSIQLLDAQGAVVKRVTVDSP